MSAETGFLIACPRSGTTWLQRAMSAHPDAVCVERRLFGRHADIVHDLASDRPRLRATLDAYVHALCGHLTPGGAWLNNAAGRDALLIDIAEAMAHRVRTWAGKRFVIDKITPYDGTSATVVGRIASLWPDAPVAHMVRDGRDVAVSGVMNGLTRLNGREGPAHARRRAWLLEGDASAALERFFLPGEVAHWARLWLEPTAALREGIASGAVHVVRYESMLADAPGSLRALLRFYGLETDAEVADACANAATFERLSGGRRRGEADASSPVRSGVAGDWMRWMTREDGEAFERIAGGQLRELGYVSDPDWWKELPERLAEPAGV